MQSNHNVGHFHEFPSQISDGLKPIKGEDAQVAQPQPYLGHPEHPHQFTPDSASSQGNLFQQPFNYDQPSVHLNGYIPLNTNLVQPVVPSGQVVIPTPSPSVCSLSSIPISSRKMESSQSLGVVEPTINGLADFFGLLKIDESGIAQYIKQQRRAESLATPTIPSQGNEALPTAYTESSGVVVIPEELMPCEDEANRLFKIFFDHIHPYIPVVHRSDFYRQWKADKAAISPLLLETIFACAGMISEDHNQGIRWLALANTHEPAFLGAPQISTIQALLLLLKAREAVSKNGYYYRSWQLVKTMISMAKDLGLHEHHGHHTDGKPCGMDLVECLIRTRIWQTLLVVEVLIGVPQGLSDFGVDPETVETRIACNTTGLDAYETERSRQYAYFVRVSLNIRRFIDAYKQTKKQDDWTKDPRFTDSLDESITDLPADLQVVLPAGGSAPWLSSHFMGNLNLHYHLSVILQHRPQLTDSRRDLSYDSWKLHMSRCYSSAKLIWHIQEAIISSYGLSSLGYVQRGIRFTVYCILTCLMTALTSPDKEFNSDAGLYFSRHMRLLERCNEKWHLPEIQAQFDAVRSALSADMDKPFELKSSVVVPPASTHTAPTPKPRLLPLETQGNVLEHNQDNVDHTSPATIFPAQILNEPDGMSATSPPMTFEMLPSIIDMDSSFHVYPDDSINNWDPTRLVTQWDLELSPSGSLSPTSSLASVVTPNRNVVDYRFPIQFPSTPVSPFQNEMPYCTYDFEAPLLATTTQDWNNDVSHIYTAQGLKRKWEGTDTLLEEPIMATET
ncbi:hypothetical protein PRK78_003985 [Emydomyces testavorans]|uniref:Xylanolytic transcriptional activator regulatory domain-containing protein n=1 Tax=Emydomyces testavorans TaxID=2070801 RepID=A0AAF0DH80_9EURO|nr:hypothetical protein PRK78_003985 [Emydomyces testavorans]